MYANIFKKSVMSYYIWKKLQHHFDYRYNILLKNIKNLFFKKIKKQYYQNNLYNGLTF